MKKYDYLIVGAGLYGSVFAERVRANNKSVLIIEKRNHIGGNCHSYSFEDTNIIVHSYGTHLFHTNDKNIWDYINKFGEFNRYQHRVLTTYQNKVYSMPINLGTINSFYNVNLKPSEIENFLESKKENIKSPSNLEEKAVSLIGRDLYEAFVKGYTWKQWQRDPKELPASIINRLPVRSSYNDSYFNDIYQGVPTEGYTKIFENMLNGVDVELNVDYFSDREYWNNKAEKIIYTGPIDRFFDFEYGKLNWRSVRFETDLVDVPDFQGTSVMNYADLEIPFTRIHEPRHLHLERKMSKNKTVVIKEYSQDDPSSPYYPVNTDIDKENLEKYNKLYQKEKSFIFGGRLAQYKYLDMHQVIAASINRAKKEFS